MSRVRVTIDRLVLNGLEPAARTALVEGLRAELSGMLGDPASRGEWAHPRRTPVLKLGRMALDPGPSGGRKFGGGLARAIGKGLRK